MGPAVRRFALQPSGSRPGEALPVEVLAAGEVPAWEADQPIAALGFLVLAPYLAALDLTAWVTEHPWAEPHRFAPSTSI